MVMHILRAGAFEPSTALACPSRPERIALSEDEGVCCVSPTLSSDYQEMKRAMTTVRRYAAATVCTV